MILAPLPDGNLRAVVRRAALPEEDVLYGEEEVRVAAELGFPRLLLCRTEDEDRLRWRVLRRSPGIPVLGLTGPVLRSRDLGWRSQGLAVGRVDDLAARLRILLARTASTSEWVEGLFADLVLVLGRSLPGEFRGFSRRVLEFPSRYAFLGDLERAAGLTPGALKARFRRRGLPSPSLYLRWFRVWAAARVLSDPAETTLTTAFRLGFSSDGNFCRWVRDVSGLTPSAIRGREGRTLLLLRMTDACFPEDAVERFESLRGLFVEGSEGSDRGVGLGI